MSGPVEDKEAFERTADEFRSTLRNLIDSHHELNQRAIDLAKINILSVSVVATGFTVVGVPDYFLLFGFGLLSIIASVVYCVHVYRPRDMHLGLGPPNAWSVIEEAVENDISEAEYYRRLSVGLNSAIQASDQEYQKEVQNFRKGLWATVGGILFFVAGLLQLPVEEFSSGAEYLLIFLISIFTHGARSLYSDEY